MKNISRLEFLKYMASITTAAAVSTETFASESAKNKMRLGLVTYQWGKDWDVPTLIKNCEQAGIYGVELRVEHAHKVMPDLTASQRADVKKMFSDSRVEIVGLGTNEQYDFVDQDRLKKSIERTKEFIRLSADVGGTGVKVKPNALHKEVPAAQTLEQIGRSLSELASYARDFGQQIRLEVHGEQTQELPNIKTIMDAANDKNATVCWNCNPQDLIGQGLEYNFNLVKGRFGDTCHVRELNDPAYPYQELMNLFKKMKYEGWILLECRTDPVDKVKALIEQRKIFEAMIS